MTRRPTAGARRSVRLDGLRKRVVETRGRHGQVIATLRNPVYLGLFRQKHDFRIGHHEPIVTHELFGAAAAQLQDWRTREPGKRYMIDWPLKGRIVCADCERPMGPQTSGIGTCFTVISDAGLRQEAGRRVGIQVSAPAIENSVEVNVSHRLGQESQIWDLPDVVIYDHRDGEVRVRVLAPAEGEHGAGR
jgi:hypothetical protein